MQLRSLRRCAASHRMWRYVSRLTVESFRPPFLFHLTPGLARPISGFGFNELLGCGVRERFQATATLTAVRDHRQHLAAGLNSGQLPERCIGLAASPLGLAGHITVTLVDQEALLKLAVTSHAFFHG